MADASQYAFDRLGEQAAFGDVGQASQNQAQIRQSFDQNRNRRAYIQAISAGGSTRQGAIRNGITGNG